MSDKCADGVNNPAAGCVGRVQDWKDISPRLGVAWDVFGNGKTAVKANVSKYISILGNGQADLYNPLGVQTDSRTWTDRNGDLFPQYSEVGPSTISNFGTRAPRFWVRIPYSAIDGKSTPHGLVLYGHGLLGAGDQVRSDFNSKIANQNNLITLLAGAWAGRSAAASFSSASFSRTQKLEPPAAAK